MNCKPGDLAVLVRSEKRENIGLFVRVLRPYLGPQRWTATQDWWVEHGASEYVCPDACLRPIRDPGEDAKDEMLRPLPNEVTA